MDPSFRAGLTLDEINTQITTMKKQTEYHPPLTALEAHMEEEIAREADMKARIRPRATGKDQACPVTENPEEYEKCVEQAMHLGM